MTVPNQSTIAIYLTRLSLGGAESVALTLARGLSQRGFHIILVVSQSGGELYDVAQREFEIVNLDAPQTLKGFIKLSAFIKNRKPDVLISHYFNCNLAALLAKIISLTKTPVLIVDHGIFTRTISRYGKVSRVVARALFYTLYRTADKIVAVSQSAAHETSRFSGMPEKAISVIYNPVISADFDVLASAPINHPWVSTQQGKLIIGIGRLSPEKGFDDLIIALSIVRKDVDARLIILGEGKEREKLEKLIHALGLTAFVDMTGYCDNIFPYLKAADLFVLSSYSESFGNVLVEALACGTSVVSTKNGGPTEILNCGQYGLLVPPYNPEALAGAILKTLKTPTDPASLSDRGRFFSVDRSIESYEALIHEVLSKQTGVFHVPS